MELRPEARARGIFVAGIKFRHAAKACRRVSWAPQLHQGAPPQEQGLETIALDIECRVEYGKRLGRPAALEQELATPGECCGMPGGSRQERFEGPAGASDIAQRQAQAAATQQG